MIPDQSLDKKIIVIAGPTAVGKTAVGISLARRMGGEIVSCDSMQVYQDVIIASNKPTSQECREVAHHLIGGVPLTESFDVAAFEREARTCMEEIWIRHKVPIFVGGTGMYIKVLLDGIFESGTIPAEIHKQTEQEMGQKGPAALHRELEAVDPQAAEKIHPNDARRIIRALEVFRFTGQPISQLQKQTDGLWGKYPIFFFGLSMDRGLLYKRIDDRVEKMFDQGLVEEVRSIQGIALSRTAQAIIGLKEAQSFLSGRCSLDEARQEMKKNTRRLAKRQITWFRAEKRLQWIDVSERDGADDVAGKIERIIKGEPDAG